MQRQPALADDADPGWAAGSGRNGGRRDGWPGVPGTAEPGLPGLPGPVLLPGASRRPPGDGHDRYSPAQLARLLGLAEPTAGAGGGDRRPGAAAGVIAGAGSGKSETMAARLVWLVANGIVRPERVLGLTFTRKAAGELGERVRARLDGLRRPGSSSPTASPARTVEPVVSTYHAYAARLVSDHALREAVEPSLRLITPAVAWQIAARVVAGDGGPMDAVSWSPPRSSPAC